MNHKYNLKKTLLLVTACLTSATMQPNNDYMSSYLTKEVTSKIDIKKIQCILEIGAFDCKDSILLSKYYNCPVIVFECAPLSIPICKKNIEDYPNIKLIEKAVWEKSGPMEFNYCSSHPGSSSIYPFDYESLAKINKNDKVLSNVSNLQNLYAMTTAQVNAIRLDEWLDQNAIPTIDLICMDTQGATLPILKSLGIYLKTIKYIITEVEYRPAYQGEELFPSIHKFMQENGFTCFNHITNDPSAFFNDVLFVRNDLLKN